eukprot:3574890-Pleurochrysis_carterae.AAC.4
MLQIAPLDDWRWSASAVTESPPPRLLPAGCAALQTRSTHRGNNSPRRALALGTAECDCSASTAAARRDAASCGSVRLSVRRVPHGRTGGSSGATASLCCAGCSLASPAAGAVPSARRMRSS